MNKTRTAAFAFTAVAIIVIGFQLALAAGAPWGAYAMGGLYPGVLPLEIRVAEVIQAFIIAGLIAVVLARAGVALPRWQKSARWLIWVVVAFSTLSLILNLITPSAVERAIWAPVGFVMLVSSFIVARSTPAE